MNAGFKVLVHDISCKLSLADFTKIFLKYGDVMTAFINTRNIYEGKVSGYVIFRNLKDSIEAISELNSSPPHYMTLKPAFSIDETAKLIGNGNNCSFPGFVADFLSSSPFKLHAGGNKSNCIVDKRDNDDGKNFRPDGMRIVPSNESPAKSWRKPKFLQILELESRSGSQDSSDNEPIKTTKISRAQKEEGLDSSDKIEKEALEPQNPDINSNSAESQGRSNELSWLSNKKVVDKVCDFANSVPEKSPGEKHIPSINKTTTTNEGMSTENKLVTATTSSDLKIKEEKNAAEIVKPSPDKVTAEAIRGTDFKKDSFRATARFHPLNESRCSTWGLLSKDPSTQIINYDLCTQQQKLSTDAFTEVVVYRCIGPGEYWIHCKSEYENLKLIGQSLQIQISKARLKVASNLTVGEYYSVNFDQSCYRCRVLSLKESKPVVQLIDFGILTECEESQLSELPEVMKNYYAQAIHVVLDPWTPEKYLSLKKNDTLRLKAVKTIDEITKVQVDGILYSQISSFPKSFISSMKAVTDERNVDNISSEEVQWPPSVLNFLKLGQELTCSVLGIKMNEDELILAIGYCDKYGNMDMNLAAFHKSCSELPEDQSLRPAIGELIAAYYEAKERWVRAVVLSEGLNCWLVACCDLGVILEVNKILKLPAGDDIGEIPSLAVRCKIKFCRLPRDHLFSEEWIKENLTLWMKTWKRNDNDFVCQLGLVKGCPLCEVIVSIWVPQTDKPIFFNFSHELERFKDISLTSGSVVRIVSYFVPQVLNVQPWNKESQLQIESLHENINNLVEKSEPLKVPPIKGKMYICTFSLDMRYYRAVVNKVNDLEHIYVTYVDYGNCEMVSMSCLYEISPELEEVPCFAVKIGLKRKFLKLFNKDAFIFLSSLIEGNEELLLVCPDGNLKSCDLLWGNGFLLSEVLKEIVDPTV